MTINPDGTFYTTPDESPDERWGSLSPENQMYLRSQYWMMCFCTSKSVVESFGGREVMAEIAQSIRDMFGIHNLVHRS